MAEIILRNVKKIYPHTEKPVSARKKGKKDEEIIKENAPNLQITEEGVVAVQEFNLHIADEEFIVLVGPSGCGKSTTLRMVAGLEEITEGEIEIDGKVVNHMPPKDRDISMVFQNYALYPHMTVYENMAFPLKLKKVDKDTTHDKVMEAAEILDIVNLLQRKPKALSGGQRQRVAIGRSIVRHPKAFLMDEPLSNLDAKLRNQMRTELIKLREKVKTTFIYVTHDQTEAMTLGDRIVIMKDGFIQQIGTPTEVFNSPANLFVAGFIGSPQMNFIETKLEKRINEYFIRINGHEIAFSEQIQLKLQENDAKISEIILGIRPEYIELCNKNDESAIEAVVDLSEMMGSSMNIHCSALEQKFIITVATLDLPEDKRFGLKLGEQIYFKFNGDYLNVFDKETGLSIL